ncbi:uncharacterized protein LOC127788074 [Diospyros lotus]|uniref:uncharacterized protein LOC127788074 n=1 Tax=Diospyros lotus TaxID=55363 RepID=UPI002256F841|nr:uncharacterized protein LOC127788074 [Diospyros lotus]
MVTNLSLKDNDLESLFSETDEDNPQVIFGISYASDVDSFSDTDSLHYEVTSIQAVLPAPFLKLHVYPEKYSQPRAVIALFDTGAATSILNPAVLHSSFWKPHTQYFQAANGETFAIEQKSKPVYLQFFPGLRIKHKFLGSTLPGKDLILGWDIISQLWKTQIKPLDKGLLYKGSFLPFVSPHNLFSLTELSTIQTLLLKDCCADTHSEFLTKCSKPLWQNPDFFISFPFKKNEDINPTKATHSGMNPEHYHLAVQELNQLKQEHLIEDTTSQWACQAFYVNKRAEQTREKLRLVINYQPLNHFLADNKFPLPTKPDLFARLTNAKIFSKFDLKAGFWQLGIHPDERFKTAFCIPNFHY